MREAVVVDMMRTPFGKAGQRGCFATSLTSSWSCRLLKGILERNKVGAEEVDEILMGSVGIAGMLTRSRHYVFEAGLPFSISATDMNKQCGSSLQACTQGAFAVMAGMSDIVLAGGVETMDRVQPIAPGDERNLGQIQTAEVMSTRDAAERVAGRQEAEVEQALVPGDGALDHGHGRDGREAGARAGHLPRGLRPLRAGEPQAGDPRAEGGACWRTRSSRSTIEYSDGSKHEGGHGPEPARGHDAREARAR